MPEPALSADFPAWGGVAHVAVTEADGLAPALDAVHRTIDKFDLACSSFREDSELAAVNAAAGTSVSVGPVLLEAVEAALRAARLTDGDVDPTVGEALVAHGFNPDLGSGVRPAITIKAVPGYATVEVDRLAGTVRIGRGVRLDLGATAKALAADCAAAAAQAQAECGVLVSLSGDLAIAGPPPPEGWRIRVTDDHRSDLSAPGQSISLSVGGLASSSTTVRHRAGESAQHHVIDPASGRPAPVHFRTVSVAAASCLDANIASTAAIVRGERAVPWLQALGLPCRLVRADGTVTHLAGWPTEDDDLSSAHPAVMGLA